MPDEIHSARIVTNDKPTMLDVISAYRLLLGREPENWSMIADHMSAATLVDLRRRFVNSPEFRATLRPLMLETVWVAKELPNGFRIWLDLADSFISQEILLGEWEPNETAYMLSQLKRGGVAVDIGANVGWFTLMAAEAVGPSGRVHAVEPNPTVLPYLSRTVVESRLQTRVAIHEFALWDTNEEMFVGARKDDYNLGHAWLLKPGEEVAESIESAKVKCVRLDDILGDAMPDFIKIDVEGAEPRVLRGGAEVVANARPVILSEVYPAQINRVSGCSARDYISDLKHQDYDCWLIENGRPTRKLDDFPWELGLELVSVAFEPRSRSPQPVANVADEHPSPHL